MRFAALVLNAKTKASERAGFACAGWTVDTPPPDVPGAGKFARSPAKPVRLDTAEGGWLPPQTVTPASPHTAYVRGDAMAGDDAELWPLVANNGASLSRIFDLQLPSVPDAYRSDIEMRLAVAASTPGPPFFSVVVNGELLKIHHPTAEDCFAQRITIPARLLTDGRNRIVLRPLGTYYGIWLQSVTFASASVPLTRSARWQQVSAGELAPGESLRRTVRITRGTTTPEPQLRAFAAQFGIDGADTDQLLAKLSAHLALRFTREAAPLRLKSVVGHDVEIEPAPSNGLTYQIWQLALVYEARGRELVHALGTDGPVVIQQFPASLERKRQLHAHERSPSA